MVSTAPRRVTHLFKKIQLEENEKSDLKIILDTHFFFSTTDFQPIRDLKNGSADSCRRSIKDFLLKIDQEGGYLLDCEVLELFY